ncbi:MAG: NmrA family NAD(P)-binding protein [Pseudomonadota bacterium]
MITVTDTQPILVIGAKGKTGSRVADQLEARGLPVRRGSRSADISFDWDNEETWAPALEGIQSAYVTYFPDLAFPGAVEKLEAFTATAKQMGLKKIVLLSGRGEYHAGRGEDVIKASGIPFTVVRAAWFAQNFSEGYLRDPILAGMLPMPGGNMVEPIIDVDDIADVVVAALTDDRHLGEVYELTGPELLTFNDMATILTETLRRPVQHLPISFEDFHANVAESGGEFVAEVFTTIARETLDGRNAHLADGVQRALGREPRSFAQYAAKAAATGTWTIAA